MSVCGRESQTEKRKFTTKEFIEDAREVHGDRYDYSKVKYINNRTNVTIICKDMVNFILDLVIMLVEKVVVQNVQSLKHMKTKENIG